MKSSITVFEARKWMGGRNGALRNIRLLKRRCVKRSRRYGKSEARE